MVQNGKTKKYLFINKIFLTNTPMKFL